MVWIPKRQERSRSVSEVSICLISDLLIEGQPWQVHFTDDLEPVLCLLPLFFPFPSYFLSIQAWLERDMTPAVKTVYVSRFLNKSSSMIYGHGKEFEDFPKDVLLSPSFNPFGRFGMEKLDPWEKNKKNYRKLFLLE